MNSYRAQFEGNTEELMVLCESITDCHHSTPLYLEEGKLVIRNFNIKNGRMVLDNTSYTNNENFDQRTSRAMPVPSDLIITREAPMGEVCIIPEGIECCLGQRMVLIKPHSEKVNNQFLLYALMSEFVQQQINKSKGTGSIVSNLRIPVLEELKIPKYDLGTQKKIGKILGDIDAKIELNNKINAELEAMAKLIYDYWFVQFDFPDENSKPYKSSGGKMVYNAELKREIPEGWNGGKLKSWIAKDKSGDWGKESEEGNYVQRVFCIRGADINGLNGKGEVKAPTRFILEKNRNKILEKGDLIVEISGGSPIQSTGRLAFISDKTLDRFEDPLICSNFCKALTLKKEKWLYNFVYQWNRLYDAGVLFGWEGKTSGIKNLLFDSFVKNYKVVLPSSDLMENFHDQVNPVHDKIQKNLEQNKKLAELRDWLLPMLMNGQVTVQNGTNDRAISSLDSKLKMTER